MLLFPVQVSERSHTPTLARQVKVFGRNEQTPVPAAQTSHSPEHGVPQQMPPAQMPDWHSPGPPHVEPFVFLG